MWYMENNKLGISVVWGRGGIELLFVLIYSVLNASWEVWLSLDMKENYFLCFLFFFFSRKLKRKQYFEKLFSFSFSEMSKMVL